MKLIVEMQQEEIREKIEDGSLQTFLAGIKGIFSTEMRMTPKEAEAVAAMHAPTPHAPIRPASIEPEAVATAIPVSDSTPQQAAPVAPSVPTTSAPVAPMPVATTTIGYSIDELAAAAMGLMDKGMQAELQSLLATFGVQSLPEMPKERYGEFATKLRELGAQI